MLNKREGGPIPVAEISFNTGSRNSPHWIITNQLCQNTSSKDHELQLSKDV